MREVWCRCPRVGSRGLGVIGELGIYLHGFDFYKGTGLLHKTPPYLTWPDIAQTILAGNSFAIAFVLT